MPAEPDWADAVAREIVHPIVLEPLLCAGLTLQFAAALREAHAAGREEAAQVVAHKAAILRAAKTESPHLAEYLEETARWLDEAIRAIPDQGAKP